MRSVLYRNVSVFAWQWRLLGATARKTAAALGVLLIGLQSAPLSAQAPCVQFDVNDSVACRDITDAEFAALNPDEKLLEARFRVSSLIRFGYESDLFQYLYVIVSPQQRVRIVDYSPKTELSSDVVGPVKVERGKQQSAAVDLGSSGGLEHQLGLRFQAHAGSDSTAHVKYEVLPPMELLAASGTMQRGAAAYFKLKPSPRTSLEGTKEFSLVLRVSRAWRGDYLHLHCAAYADTGRGSRQSADQPVCGSGAFVLPLYVEGDLQAKETAQRYLHQERQLRRLADSYAAEIQKQRYPTVGHRLGAMIDLVQPKIPDTWLHQVLADPSGPVELDFRSHLPDEVNDAIDQFWAARRALRALSGSSPQPLAWQMAPAK